MTAEHWHDAIARHAQWEDEQRRAGHLPPGLPWWVRRLLWFAAGFAVFYFVMHRNEVRSREMREQMWEQMTREHEKTVAAALQSGLKAERSEGTFTTDVYLTNQSDAQFGPCDLTLTVFFESGKQLSVPRFWAGWAGGERKTVNFPSGGKIERVDLAGTVTNAGGTARAQVNLTFAWKQQMSGPGK